MTRQEGLALEGKHVGVVNRFSITFFFSTTLSLVVSVLNRQLLELNTLGAVVLAYNKL